MLVSMSASAVLMSLAVPTVSVLITMSARASSTKASGVRVHPPCGGAGGICRRASEWRHLYRESPGEWAGADPIPT